jgi:hypothetical protein
MMQRLEREIERKGRARICKRSKSPGIDFKESIPPGYIGWQNRFLGSFNVYGFRPRKGEKD